MFKVKKLPLFFSNFALLWYGTAIAIADYVFVYFFQQYIVQKMKMIKLKIECFFGPLRCHNTWKKMGRFFDYRQITLRIVGYHFSPLLTVNLCPIYLKLLVHVL